MTTRYIIRVLLAFQIMAGAGPGGCVQLAKAPPEKRYYSVQVSRPMNGSAPPRTGAIVKIRGMRVSPRFAGRELVYRTSELRYESDFYHEWFVSPDEMLTQQLRDWLSDAALFRYVVDSSSSLEAPYLVEGEVSELYGDYRFNGSPKAVLSLQFLLIKDLPTHDELVFRRDYRRAIEVSDSSPDALAKGWNDGFGQMLAALEEDLRNMNLQGNGEPLPGASRP